MGRSLMKAIHPGFLRGILCALAAVVACSATEPNNAAPTSGHASFSSTQLPGVVWKDRIAEGDLWHGNWHRDGSAMAIEHDQAFIAFPETLTDGAIRVRFKYEGPGGSFIDLINRGDGKANGSRYVVTLFIGKEDDHRCSASMRFRVEEGDKPKNGGLGGAGGLAQLRPGDEHTLELFVQGDRLLYYFDGSAVISAQNSERKEGRLELFTGGQVRYLSIETADLSKAPPLAGGSGSSSKPGSAPSTPTTTLASRTTPAPVAPPLSTAPATARTLPATPTTPSENHTRTGTVGGQSGKDFAETQPEGGVLVGFDVWKGTYYRELVIGGIRAIYQTPKGQVHGRVFGRGEGEPDLTMLAKRGASPITRVDSVGDQRQVVGFRVAFANGEQSDWIGQEFPKNIPLNRVPKNLEQKRLNISHPALGIFGGADGTLFRFGLIY